MTFCKDSLWNETLTWNTDNPNLTSCLRNTVLPSIPAAILWLAAPFWFYHLRTHTTKLVPKVKEKVVTFTDRLTFLFCSKFILTLLLLVNVICELVLRIEESSGRDEEVSSTDIYYAGCLVATFSLSLVMLCYEKKNFFRTSPPLSIFWTILFIVSVPTFKVDIEACINDSSNVERIILTATFFPVIFLLILANVFADRKDLVAKEDQKLSAENKNSFFSNIFVSWLDPTIWKGYRHGPLTQDMLGSNPGKISVEASVEAFRRNWDRLYQEKINKNSTDDVGLIWPLLQSFGWRFLWANMIAVVHYSIIFVNPQVLKLLINFVDNAEEETWKGYMYAVLLFANQAISTLFFQNYLNQLMVFAVNVRNALITAIFQKSLRLSSKTRTEHTTGEITNYISVDAQRYMDTIPYICIMWSTPLQVVLAFIFLYLELGTASFAGLVVLAFLIPFNLIISKFGEIIQSKQLKAKDERIKLMNEILAGMKVLKVYAWEIPFMKRLARIRRKEVRTLKLNAIYWAVMNFTYTASTIFISIATFTTYVLLDPENNILTAEKIFVTVSLLNMLRIPLTLFPMVTKEMIKLFVSTKRIRKFLNSEELQEGTIEKQVEDPKNAVEIREASFSWDKDSSEPTLKNLNLNIPKGSLTAIVGIVGSGKSSIISAILGDVHKTAGDIRRLGSVAYVPQVAWIQNLTLRDNILFGRVLDSQKYNKVIDACALRPDFDILVARDSTEIGENGINLSGGQKQRVSLARASYSDSDIILLDDPLSAVDAHVAKHLFEELLSSETGLLKDKTRILATHSISFLPNVDHIVVMKNGRIDAQGTYKELMDNEGAFAEFINEHSTSQAEESEETVVKEKTIDQVNEKPKKIEEVGEEEDGGRLIEDEVALSGRVNLSIYKYYAKSIGYIVILVVVSLYGLEQGFRTGANVWLKHWADINAFNATNNDTMKNLGIYAALGVSGTLFQITMDVVFLLSCARAAKLIHEKLLYRVMRSPMAFFDTNPIGRILNRFSSDIDVVDGQLPFQFGDFVWCFMEAIAIICVIGSTTPYFLIVVFPLAFLYLMIQRFFIPSSRQLKRLYSISKSPVFSHFSETVAGAQCIRAYGEQKRFIAKSEYLVDTNNKSLYLNFVANRWLGVRIENLGNCITLFAAIFAIVNRDNLTAGEAGLSISYSLNIFSVLTWMMRMLSEIENNCVAIERISEYSNNPYEAAWDVGEETPKEDWPTYGAIEMKDYQTRYREGLDPVLKGLSLKVLPGEKIGICGRTGAGKSSLTLALFRIIEPTAGEIIIDGHNICKLGLHALRSKLTIIPQDPVLFSGDLRFNLDPTGENTDADLWRALELSHLKEHIDSNLEGGLDHIVTEGGSNFSVGQRQLICLARALLRKTKILILDEATAAVDLQTDQLIQTTIKEEFSDCTVLTVAHRLKTILDCDRIAVLSDGKLQEVGEPEVLLNQPDSSLRSMAQDAGLL